MLRFNLKKLMEEVLLKTNSVFSLSPPVIDNCVIKLKTSSSKEECIKDIKKVRSIIEKAQVKYKDFLYNQVNSVLIFLEHKENLEFEDLLRNVFGVKPLGIDEEIKQMEKKLSKVLNAKDLYTAVKHWKENIAIPSRLIKKWCIDIINLLHDITKEKTKIDTPLQK